VRSARLDHRGIKQLLILVVNLAIFAAAVGL
jgi:hypothetical protein